MGLGTSKKIIDNFFTDHWVNTPVQYEGTRFIEPPDKEWIALQTLPYDAQIIGFDGNKGRKQTYYVQKIRCFHTNAQRAFELADAIMTLFSCMTLDNLRIGLGVSDGNGAVNLHNECYVVTLDFEIIES